MTQLRPSRWSAVLLVWLAAAGAGWANGYVMLEAGQQPPVPPWAVPAGLTGLAAVVTVLAWNLRRRLSSDAQVRAKARPISPLSGVRYVAGAKACLHGGAALAGFYAGLAVALVLHVGQPQRRLLVACLVSAVASLLVGGAGWWLERACKVQPPDDPQSLAGA